MGVKAGENRITKRPEWKKSFYTLAFARARVNSLRLGYSVSPNLGVGPGTASSVVRVTGSSAVPSHPRLGQAAISGPRVVQG
jgi:hypothetical protein